MDSKSGEGTKTIALELQRLIDEEESGVLALVVRSIGSAPGKVGAKMIVLPDGSISGTVGGGVVEARVIADSLNALDDGRGPRTLHYKLDELGMSCGGEISVYLEPLQPAKRVVIYGGGHVSAAVARLLATLDCRISVVDERSEWANRDRFPDVDEIVNRPFAEQIASQPPGSKDHVLIVTRGHDQDQIVLEGVIGRSPAWLGVIGSKRKAAKTIDLLKAKDIPAEQIKKIRCPVGLDIGAVTPEEIAIAVAAELVFLWRRGSAVAGVPKGTQSQSGKSMPQPKPYVAKKNEKSLEDVVFDDSEDD
ncbi:MAG TPA: XdhC/CoxI family protein [Myxococcota bacterium]|nr:XdhC/CoxI family protein [Myxococcota bacterium]